MPVPMIEHNLTTGALVRLQMPDDRGGMYRFATVSRRDTPPGPAACSLRQQFVVLGSTTSMHLEWLTPQKTTRSRAIK